MQRVQLGDGALGAEKGRKAKEPGQNLVGAKYKTE